MRELISGMFIPEFTITNETLKNIANVSYSKSIIENTILSPKWQKQLANDARSKTIAFSLQRFGLNVGLENVKRYVNKMPIVPARQIVTYNVALDKIEQLGRTSSIEEKDIKELLQVITGKATYRNKALKEKSQPEEVLAELANVLDWYHSFEAMDTHPILKAGILKAKIEQLVPFDEEINSLMSDILTNLSFQESNFAILNFCSFEEHYLKTRRRYNECLYDVNENDDYTIWLEYFSEVVAHETSEVSENVKLISKETKLAKLAGEITLTSRQEMLIEYIHNFGQIQNKDFPKLFPSISEDTILRELKDLTSKNILQKQGKTKSSRYILK